VSRADTVSVVIPTYNRAHCIRDAIESALHQSAPPHEILVIDDGSTDDTESIVEAIGSPLVRYVRKPNAGVSSARNLGIEMATGHWIAFLDSDDTWRPTKLELQLRCLAATGSAVCFTGAVSEDGERQDGIAELDPHLPADEWRSYPRPVEFIARSLLHPLVVSLMISRKALKDAGGFDEDMVAAEDTALFYDLTCQQDIVLLNIPLVDITRERVVAGLSDHQNAAAAAARLDCAIRVQTKALGHVSGQALPPDETAASIRIVRKRIAYFLSRRSEVAHAAGDHALGRRLAREAISLTGDWRTMVRSAMLAYGYRWMAPRLQRKWPSD
jgi:glycosyltransferase involved in cell wall biosynthesis